MTTAAAGKRNLFLTFFTLQGVSAAAPPPSPQTQESWDPADKDAATAPGRSLPNGCGNASEGASRKPFPRSAAGFDSIIKMESSDLN